MRCRVHCSLPYTLPCTLHPNLLSPYFQFTLEYMCAHNSICAYILYKQAELFFPTLVMQAHNSETCSWEKGEAALGWWDKPLPSTNEQVRKTAPAPDYTVSRRATNPALAIHPVLCADLLTTGQMPMTLPACIICCLWRCLHWFHCAKKGHSIRVRLTNSSCSAF